MIDTVHLSRALTERFGLEVEATASLEENGQKIIISPCGIGRTISFRVELLLGWRSILASFIPGNYASGLVSGMKTASSSQQAAFAIFSDSLKSKGAIVTLQLDDCQVDASAPSSWPQDWTSIHISMKKVGVVVEKVTGYDFDAAFPWATGFIGLSIALLPLEEEKTWSEGESEGAVFHRTVKQYERSRINRAACIEIQGTNCLICGFSFGNVFGGLGEGFIHVHHVVALSDMGGSYVLNPATDLIPVCPNCHAMLHRHREGLTPEQLIQVLNG
jgi:5-methylcytosine-specific restriction enzyme A